MSRNRFNFLHNSELELRS
ncbi:hypothetical protein AB3S75_031077 [Citrus x aurantiifolia]